MEPRNLSRTPALPETIRAGLDWLVADVQPPGASLSHHGRSTQLGDLSIRFAAGYNGVEGRKPGRGHVSFALPPGTPEHPTAPFNEQECAALRALVARHRAIQVVDTWNGAGYTSFTVAIAGVAPSINRAAQLHEAGWSEQTVVEPEWVPARL